LPVRNHQHRLSRCVLSILDVLGELTDRFDLLIVDYGSEDETREVALELVREFPQVDYLDRGRQEFELFGAVEAGIRRTTGDIIFVHDPSQPLGLAELQRLWRMRNDDDLIMVQSRFADGSLFLIRRPALWQSQTRPATASATSPDRLRRTDRHEATSPSLRLPKMLARLSARQL
jgi:glycosyltransferase involved in cell wall biosynthesis